MKPRHYLHPRSHLLVWAILLLFSIIPSSATQKHTEISTFPFQESLKISPSNPRFYRLSLVNTPKDLDLLISVIPEGRSDAPSLYVSKTKEFPQTMNDADYSSASSESGNTVLINHKDLSQAPTNLFVGLHSEDSSGCNAKISVEWTKTMANEEKSIENFNDPKAPPKLLSTRESYYEVIAKDTSIYYAMHIPDRNALFVQIQFTRFFGDFDIFISNSTKYPNHQDSTEIQVFHKDLFIIRGAPLLSEVYYIGVHALKASSFSLSAIFASIPRELPYGHRAWHEITEDRAFSLTPGRAQKGFYMRDDDKMKEYYKIYLNQPDDWEGTLCIQVNSPTKVYISMSNNGKAPEYNDMMWWTKNYRMEIPSSDPKFLKQGLYYVRVGLARDPGDPEIPEDLTHYVTYTIEDKLPNPAHCFLSPKIFCNGTIKKGESRYFETLLLEDDSPMTIYKAGDLDLYISTDPKNKYPGQHSYSLLMKDEITLTHSEICGTETPLGCSIYITAVSTGDQPEMPYSLSVKSGSTAIALEEGHEIQLPIPVVNNRTAFFYYQPASLSRSSVITVSCPPGREFVVYAKRTKSDLESLEQLWREAPNENTAEWTSSNVLSVPQLGDFSLAISVYFKDNTEGSETTYKIMASSQITYFITNNPKTGEIKKDHYQYFKFKMLNARCTSLISLATTDENAQLGLVISRGENTRPTLLDHQFASISRSKAHILEINNTDISPEQSMKGYWVIGVYGYTSASWTLKVAYEDHKMLELKPGVPVEMSLQWQSVVFFRYFHESERHLQINLTQLSGEVKLYATDFAKQFPDEDHHKWKILTLHQAGVFTSFPQCSELEI